MKESDDLWPRLGNLQGEIHTVIEYPTIVWLLFKELTVSTILMPAAAAAKSLQSCPTLCDPIDGSTPGSPVPGVLQARTLDWVAISFSNAWKWKVKVKSPSRVLLFETPWTAAHQAPPPMGLSRQEYWSGVPLPSPSRSYSVANSKNSQKLVKQRKMCYKNTG